MVKIAEGQWSENKTSFEFSNYDEIWEENNAREMRNINEFDESDYGENEADDPTEWTHESYTGDATIYMDEDGGIYRYEADEDGESDFQLVGFYDLGSDTLTITK